MKIKKILITILCSTLIGVSLSSCASNELPAQENPSVVGGYTSQITFNYISDANSISYMNPKIRTIVLVAKQNPSAVAIIKFNSFNAKDFALNIQSVLNKEGVKTEVIGFANKQKEAEVSVYVKFKPLDQVLKAEQKESEINSMTNITGMLN